jgi:hypothetical protein
LHWRLRQNHPHHLGDIADHNVAGLCFPDAQLRGLQPADPVNALSFLCGNYYLTVYNLVTFE